jgi:nucleotide-binding universal stress UspA family protein
VILQERSSRPRDADVAIVGSQSLNRLQRLILGSVSSKVARDAACDVVVR